MGETPVFVAMVEFLGEKNQKFMVIGEESVFYVDEKLTMILKDQDIKYSAITKIE